MSGLPLSIEAWLKAGIPIQCCDIQQIDVDIIFTKGRESVTNHLFHILARSSTFEQENIFGSIGWIYFLLIISFLIVDFVLHLGALAMITNLFSEKPPLNHPPGRR